MTSCAGAPHGGGSRDDWTRARAVAEQHLESGEAIEEEVPRLPFMFFLKSQTRFAVLVHNGALFERRGLAGLDIYLRESKCVEQRLPNVDDMLTLMRFLEAGPPGEKPHGYIRKRADETALRPRLEYLDGGSARLVLYYRTADDGPEDGGDGPSDPVLSEWTLTMDPGQMPVWTRKGRVWNSEGNAFYDDRGN